MNQRLAFLIIVIMAILSMVILGCGDSNDSDISCELDFISRNIKFSDIPELGKPIEMTFIFTVNEPVGDVLNPQSDFKAWLKFYRTKFDGSHIEAKQRIAIPTEEVVLSGSTTWQGSLSEDDTVQMKCTVRFPAEGIWDVIGSVREEREDEKGHTLTENVRLAITEEASGIFGDESLSEAGLDYLKNADYGHSGRIHPNEVRPVAIELNMPKPPLVNEEVEVTCTIESIEDYENYYVELGKFLFRASPERNEVVPVDDIVISGTTSWGGNLKNGCFEEFSFNIRFPKAGDWLVAVSGESPEDKTRSHNSDSIRLNVTDQRSSYGWEDFPSSNDHSHDDEAETEPMQPDDM